MLVESSALPRELAALVDVLAAHGFKVVEERRDDDHFGDQLMVFSGRHARIRVVRDRGQWFVEAATANGDWYAPVIWLAHLGGETPPLATRALADDAEFVRERLDDIEDAANDETRAVDESLFELRWQRAAARRAMPPDEGVSG
jgi:hypothetical protein